MTDKELDAVKEVRNILESSQSQIDEDGVMIGVSRQALAEVLGGLDAILTYAESLRAKLASETKAREAAEKRIKQMIFEMNSMKSFETCTLYGVPVERYAEFLDKIIEASGEAAQEVIESRAALQVKAADLQRRLDEVRAGLSISEMASKGWQEEVVRLRESLRRAVSVPLDVDFYGFKNYEIVPPPTDEALVAGVKLVRVVMGQDVNEVRIKLPAGREIRIGRKPVVDFTTPAPPNPGEKEREA